MSDDGLTAWERFKKAQGNTRPWDVVNPKTEYVDKEVSDSRWSICKECPELIKLTSQCKKCGCLMPVKVKLLEAECPIGLWGAP